MGLSYFVINGNVLELSVPTFQFHIVCEPDLEAQANPLVISAWQHDQAGTTLLSSILHHDLVWKNKIKSCNNLFLI